MLKLLLSLLSFSLVGFVAPGVLANEVTYYCGTYDGHPATIARLPGKGAVALISWRTMFFGLRYTPLVNCENATENFQELMTGQYRYVVWGTRNGQNVMCASNSGPANFPIECPSDRILFTLEPSQDPIYAIRHLGRLGSLSGEGPLVLDPVFVESPDGRTLGLDWEYLMERAPEAYPDAPVACQNLWSC